MDKTIINNKDEAYAKNILQKFYDEGLIPAEKKPYLTKLSLGNGPYLAIETKEGKAHYILDAASQIATLGHGFNPSSFFGTIHHKAAWTNDPEDESFKELRKSYHQFIERKLDRENLEISFTNSGAEANELAIAMSFEKRVNKRAHKILAFKGSFHGRMLLSLYSTWNPAKREPFQWEGHETEFVEYPELNDDKISRTYPSKWKAFWESSEVLNRQASKPEKWDYTDDALSTEVDCLWEIRNQFLSGEIFCILAEPMQCEGGDRFSSDRFHCALALMAKQFGVSLIYDEVQTGFHLGREFFWHQQFNLTDSLGTALNPDYIICAKKAQVGMVIFEANDLNPSVPYCEQQFQVASVIRGYIHALGLDQSQSHIHALEDMARTRLEKLIKKYSQYIGRPRACGMSFAFEVNDQDKVNEFIAKRFDHGLLYYPAGAKTLRFRLNTAFKERDIDFLFAQLELIIERIYHDTKVELPEVPYKANKKYRYKRWENWHQRLLTHKLDMNDTPIDDFIENELEYMSKACQKDLELIEVNRDNFSDFKNDIIRLESEVYEPTRQTAIEQFEITAMDDHSVCYALKIDSKTQAIIFAGPIELYPFERGLRRDPDFGKNNSLYMIDTTVHHKYQNFGLGKFLKYALTLKASENGLTYIKGRNRDRLAAGMLMINLSLGAYEQFYIPEDYPDHAPHRDVLYYKQTLKWNQTTTSLSNRINSSLDINQVDHEFLHGQIPQIVNKVCLSNFVGVRFLEELKYVANEMPEGLRHLYTTSGQSECVDKIAKSILYKNPKSFTKESYFLTFDGHFFGNGSNLSRSLSSSRFNGVNTESSPYFKTKRLPHPTESNYKEILSELESIIKDPNLRGIWIEPVRQKDYRAVDQNFLKELRKITSKNGIALIYNESASQQFIASKDHYFISKSHDLTPDMAMAFLGGQMGLCFMNEHYYLNAPLMMISTWDGDEYALSQYKKAMEYILKNKPEILKKRQSINRGIQDHPIDYTQSNTLRKTLSGLLMDPSDMTLMKKS